jgi:hypothetical protein
MAVAKNYVELWLAYNWPFFEQSWVKPAAKGSGLRDHPATHSTDIGSLTSQPSCSLQASSHASMT